MEKNAYTASELATELVIRIPNAVRREDSAAKKAEEAIARHNAATKKTRERATRLAEYLPVIIRPVPEGEMLEIKRWHLESQGKTGDPSGESRQAGSFEVHGIDYQVKRDGSIEYHLKGPEASSYFEGGQEVYHTTWEAVTATSREIAYFIIQKASDKT